MDYVIEPTPQLLERTIVAVLKGSMSRDHPCFRQCYDRLFNLCKTFLKVCAWGGGGG